jgi:hypothetical protein
VCAWVDGCMQELVAGCVNTRACVSIDSLHR